MFIRTFWARSRTVALSIALCLAPLAVVATPVGFSQVERTPVAAPDQAGDIPSASASTFEPTPAAVMVVLDGSGSMWGQIEGKAKIQIAREVMAELMAGWDTTMNLGLMSYGHRRKSDCDDIETLIAVGKADPAAVTSAVQKINPKGKTPLSESVRRAAIELRYTEQPATVLLVSDGIETCDADPCAVGTELAMNGTAFTAHVISFDVKEEEQTGLRCLAERTGGLFLATANARELYAALEKTVAKAKEPPRPIVQEPGDASLEAAPEVAAGSLFEIKWVGANSRDDYITMVKPDAPEGSYENYAYTATGNPVRMTAPDEAGDYELRYVFGHRNNILATRPIRVTPVKASVRPETEVAAGDIVKVEWQGPNNRGDYINLVRPGASNAAYLNYASTSYGSPASIQVPDETGEYEVRYVTGQSNLTLASATFSATAVGAFVRAPAEVPAGAQFTVEWKGPDYTSDYITIVEPGAADTAYGEYIATSYGSPAKLIAPAEPGTYEARYVLYQSGTVLARTDFVVTAVSASVQAPDTVATGSNFQVSWAGPNYPNDYITVVPAGSADSAYLSYATTASGSTVTLQAPAEPGSYEVRYIADHSRKALARQPITVE